MDTAPVRLQKAFVEALGELPVRVLWKYESELLGDLPKNVMIRKWFPQRDILGNYLSFLRTTQSVSFANKLSKTTQTREHTMNVYKLIILTFFN